MLISKELLGLYFIYGLLSLSHALSSPERDYFTRKSNIEKKTFDMREAKNGGLLYTNLDDSNEVMLNLKRFYQQQTLRTWDDLYELNRRRGKLQAVVNSSTPFPCNTTGGRSPEVPVSVHRLRPGDIDIIAVVGDSLSAGTNLLSDSYNYLLTEFRGMSFSGGGDSDWRHCLTLPNIFKVYNPKVYGYAENLSLVVDRKSRFNLAEPMMYSDDLIYQVEVLIERLRNDAKVDMERQWKLLTILVGSNDLCSDICHYDNQTVKLEQHEQQLRRALQILRDNVPRLMINVMTSANLLNTVYQMKDRPLICTLMHTIFCNCIFNLGYSREYISKMSDLMDRWGEIDRRVTSLAEFHDREDFTVNYQPVLFNSLLWILPNGRTDYRYFSDDCFHLSQLGHATLANELWNNMLRPTSLKKRRHKYPFYRFLCPSEERPYLYTRRNAMS